VTAYRIRYTSSPASTGVVVEADDAHEAAEMGWEPQDVGLRLVTVTDESTGVATRFRVFVRCDVTVEAEALP